MDYSLLIMWWLLGWWRWPPEMIPPSGRVPEWGLDWLSVATEPCGGGTSNLGLFLMVFSIYRNFWRRSHVQMGLVVSTINWGTNKGLGMPWWVVPSSWIFWPSHEASGVSFVPKQIVKKFQLIWRTFISAQKTTPWQFCWKQRQSGLVPCKSYQNHIKLL